MEMRLYDSTGRLMAGRRYTGPSHRFRIMAHKFANEILYAFTGVRGSFDTEIAFPRRREGPGKRSTSSDSTGGTAQGHGEPQL